MHASSINAERLLHRIRKLGDIGRDDNGVLRRLAASDTDKLGRDAFTRWSKAAGLEVRIDRVGNIFAIWPGPTGLYESPIIIGSHIDTVINAGILDGCYGVLSGLEVVQSLKEAGLTQRRPLVVAAFTNEEGVRFAPDMMGSSVFAGSLPVEQALATVGTDGVTLGAELERIGYLGPEPPGIINPHAYVEPHIEQGPVLEREGIHIGVVDGLQGFSWQRLSISGEANHAGTTPMSMRRDAGYAAARVIDFLHKLALEAPGDLVATVGCLSLSPNAINVVPSEADLTVDMRSPGEGRLVAAETALTRFLDQLQAEDRFSISVSPLARTTPVRFDDVVVRLIEHAVAGRGLTSRRMTSGAGHDAQMVARLAPTAMIFVPSAGGISHSPREYTKDHELVAGANVLLDTVKALIRGATSL